MRWPLRPSLRLAVNQFVLHSASLPLVLLSFRFVVHFSASGEIELFSAVRHSISARRRGETEGRLKRLDSLDLYLTGWNSASVILIQRTSTSPSLKSSLSSHQAAFLASRVVLSSAHCCCRLAETSAASAQLVPVTGLLKQVTSHKQHQCSALTSSLGM